MRATTAFYESGRRDLRRLAASAAGAGRSPASGAKAPHAPKLHPRPPDAEPARRAGVADAAGKGRVGGVNPMRLVREPSYDTE